MRPKIGDIITLYKGYGYEVHKLICKVINITENAGEDVFNFDITCDVSHVLYGEEISHKGIRIFTDDFITYHNIDYEPFGTYHRDRTEGCKMVMTNIEKKIKELEKKRAEALKVFYLG